jgi:NNP family nitrate/nitrite transporter-like MFS transporter
VDRHSVRGLKPPAVFALALIPVSMTWLMIALLARDAPNPAPARTLREYAAPLKTRDAWWFCVFYSITFGGFVGLTSFLSIFFHDEYGLSMIEAGNLATLCAVFGSLIRPLGGYLSDRLGGIRMLFLLYLGLAAAMGGMSLIPPLAVAATLLFLGMGFLGMGNGAVFQLVPLRFPREIGVLTGLVGAAGGVGGFILPLLLGVLKGKRGSFSGAFLAFSFAGLTCAVILAIVSRLWVREFVGRGGLAPQSA